jgi:anthranilate phosphoribosyltransferase
LKGGDAKTNAGIIRGILSGTEKRPRKDIVVLNAAAAIIVAGLADNFKNAIELADEAITNQKAIEALEKLIEVSNS